MEVTIDNYGRIVIPKAVRERLGLEAGATLELEVEPPAEEGGAEAVQLRPRAEQPVLQRKDGVLVHTGRMSEPAGVVELIREQRMERTRTLSGRQRSPSESD